SGEKAVIAGSGQKRPSPSPTVVLQEQDGRLSTAREARAPPTWPGGVAGILHVGIEPPPEFLAGTRVKGETGPGVAALALLPLAVQLAAFLADLRSNHGVVVGEVEDDV